MYSGNFLLALHTHLPWVLHHGAWPHGSDWLCEAAAECYIPLMNIFNELLESGISAKVTIDISPVLCEQLEHPDFKPLLESYCDQKIAAAQRDEKQFTDWGYDPHHIYLTKFWQKWYDDRKNNFIYNYNSSIISGLRKLQDTGAVEIATCGATHGYLPLLGYDRSIDLQIHAAAENYKKHFHREPRGIWLPECAYRNSYIWKSLLPINPFDTPRLRPGLEQFIAKYGIDYFFTDQNLTDRATPLGVYLDSSKERFLPVHSPEFHPLPYSFMNMSMNPFHVSSSEKTEYGTAIALTRHKEIAMQVWSGESGYPGEPNYLDFHKRHLGSMLRYWRVTDNKADMMYKLLYHPDWIWEKIDLQTNHFIHHIENTLNYFHKETNRFGTLCTPFDTELFGHWWFEGPEFLKSLFRGLHNSPYVKTATASEQLFKTSPREVMLLPEGSWGEHNNHDVWSNNDNLWTWENLYNNENRLKAIYEKHPPATTSGEFRRVLTQALRELMLMQASDWQFLIFTGSGRDYAEQRFSFHHSDFNKLCDLAEKFAETGSLSVQDYKYIEETEKRNSIFPELKLEWWN